MFGGFTAVSGVGQFATKGSAPSVRLLASQKARGIRTARPDPSPRKRGLLGMTMANQPVTRCRIRLTKVDEKLMRL